jgi:biotin-(acetyl-CoA carboxylase) ligase
MLSSVSIHSVTTSLRGAIFAIFLLVQTLAFANESFERIHFDEINSTQTYAKKHAADFLDSLGKWVAVTAERQSNGLGSQGRKWESSSSGNLYVTFVTLYPRSKSEELSHIIQISGFSVAQTLKDFNLNPQIKWVNDVFLGAHLTQR